MPTGSWGCNARSSLLGIPAVVWVTEMSDSSADVSGGSSFCGHCRFFGQCSSEDGVDYGDWACWEYIENGVYADNDATG